MDTEIIVEDEPAELGIALQTFKVEAAGVAFSRLF